MEKTLLKPAVTSQKCKLCTTLRPSTPTASGMLTSDEYKDILALNYWNPKKKLQARNKNVQGLLLFIDSKIAIMMDSKLQNNLKCKINNILFRQNVITVIRNVYTGYLFPHNFFFGNWSKTLQRAYFL